MKLEQLLKAVRFFFLAGAHLKQFHGGDIIMWSNNQLIFIINTLNILKIISFGDDMTSSLINKSFHQTFESSRMSTLDGYDL